MLCAGMLPAESKYPPAYNSFPNTHHASTPFLIPLASADQLVPFHFAILFTETPPAFVKLPAAYNSPLYPAIATTDPKFPFCIPVIPLPSADQFVPFHFAMLLALIF